LIAQEMHIFLL